MAKTFAVTINTKPYLKKYLHKLYGNPLVFSYDNLFGITLAAFLSRHCKDVRSHDNKEVIRQRFDRLQSTIEVHLPITFLTQRRGGYDITVEQTITVNKFFEKRFEEDLWKLCLIMGICGVDKKDALDEFCNTYNIEIDEDITMDALKKKEDRYNTRMKNSDTELSAESFNTRKKYSKKFAPDLSEE